MNSINDRLRAILDRLNQIDYGKEMDQAEYDSLTEDLDTNIDTVLTDENVGYSELEQFVGDFKTVKDKTEREAKLTANGGRIRTTDTSLNKKIEISGKIVDRYEKLFKQKEVVRAYAQNFDPKDLISSKESLKKGYERNLKKVEKAINRIEVLRTDPEFENLVNLIEMEKNHKKAVALITECKNAENQYGTASESAMKQFWRNTVEDIRKQLKDIFTKLGINFADYADANLLKKDLDTWKKDYDVKIKDCVDSIKSKVNDDEKLKKVIGEITVNSPEDVLNKINSARDKKISQQAQLVANIEQTNKDVQNLTEYETRSNATIAPAEPAPTRPASFEPTEAEVKRDSRYQQYVNPTELAKMETSLGEAYDNLPMKKGKIRTRMEFLKQKAQANGTKAPNPIAGFFKSMFGGRKIDREMKSNYIGENLEKYIDNRRQGMSKLIERENEADFQQQLVDHQNKEAQRVQDEQAKSKASGHIAKSKEDFVNSLTKGVISQGVIDEKNAGRAVMDARQNTKVEEEPTQ